MKKLLLTTIMAFIIMLLSISAAEAKLDDKYITKQFGRNNELFYMQIRLCDFDGDGKYDYCYTLLFHWDKSKKKWYQCGDYNTAIGKINSSSSNSDISQIDLCEQISNINTQILFTHNAQAIDSTFFTKPFSVFFYDNENYEGPGFAELAFDGIENFEINKFYNAKVSEANDIAFAVHWYFPDDMNEYSYSDFEYSVNQIANQGFINIQLGKFMAKVHIRYELFDINGNVVKSELVTNRTDFKINVSDLQNGTYILKDYMVDGSTDAQTILISN